MLYVSCDMFVCGGFWLFCGLVSWLQFSGCCVTCLWSGWVSGAFVVCWGGLCACGVGV